MPYNYQGVFDIDGAKRIDITRLKRIGLIKPGFKCSGPVEWNEKFKINIEVGIRSSDSITGKMRLSYNCGGEGIDYVVDLVSRRSNLGTKSIMWLMICPFTFKVCRKLYFNGTHFVHRDHVRGMYRIQMMSRKARESEQLLSYLLGPTQIYDEIQKKHLKKYYRGVPTKRFKKLLSWKERIDNISARDIEWLYITGSLPPGL
jgi:hypothetical protein